MLPNVIAPRIETKTPKKLFSSLISSNFGLCFSILFFNISFSTIFFEKEKQRVRTPEVNLLFELTKRTTGIYENKKSGILTHNEMDSALVGNEGLEPPTSSL